MEISGFEKRLDAVKKLLEKHLISDQQVLVELLKNEFDIESTQSLVSRDLRKLGAIKQQTQGGLYYTLPQKDVKAEILRLAIRSVQYNESLIVIHTEVGMAAFVGDCLDHSLGDEILGCLAGENVVFVAPLSVKKIAATCEKVCQKLYHQTAVNRS